MYALSNSICDEFEGLPRAYLESRDLFNVLCREVDAVLRGLSYTKQKLIADIPKPFRSFSSCLSCLLSDSCNKPDAMS